MVIDLLTEFTILLFSIVILGISSNFVIKNTEKISRITRLGEMTLGFILLSLVSSIPEISVVYSSILEKTHEISVGNIFGGSIQRITLILGILALAKPILISKGNLRSISVILFLTSAIPFLFMFEFIPSRIIGIFLISIFFYFGYYSIKKRIVLTNKGFVWKTNLIKLLVFVCFGLALVIISARVSVILSSDIAKKLGISESLIGATILTFGTTLPEFSLSISCLKRKRFSLLLGNLIGSNLTVLTLVLGAHFAITSSLISDISIFSTLFINLLIANIVLWIFFEREKLERFEGIFLILLYILFLTSLLGIGIII